MHPIRVYERQGADLNVTEDGLRSPHGPVTASHLR